MIPTETLRMTLRDLPAHLKQRVVCQEAAIDLVVERLQHAELGLTRPGRPKASFLLLGPTGVGKTKLVLEFTRELLGEGKLVRLDMSEFQTQERLGLLLGTSQAEPGRIAEGYEACGGVGTLLLDEIEKAHPRVLDILLQILEPARLTTGANRVLDFSNWYVAMTSNIGAARVMTMRRSIRDHAPSRAAGCSARTAARDFRAHHRSRRAQPARLRCAEANRRAGGDRRIGRARRQWHVMAASHGVTDVVINRGYNERLGARPMRDAAERMVRSALATDLLRGGRGTGRLQADASGTKLELLPAASAALK